MINDQVLIKPDGKLPDEAERGRIYLTIGRVHHLFNDANPGESFECVISGTLITPNKSKTLACVGDYAWYTREGKNNGKIVKVEQRQTYIGRRMVALGESDHIIASNLDILLVFMSAAEPFYNRRLIDRYLVSAELGALEPVICINKMDLMPHEFIREDLTAYEKLGVKVYYFSALRDENTEELIEYLKGKEAIMSGPSGTGKSTFMNLVMGDKIQHIANVSLRTSKGKHTTTFTQMFNVDGGGKLVDSPGIREFGLIDINKNELSTYFPEFIEYSDTCKFMPCSHTHEPGCAVKEAVESGEIDPQRYDSYIMMLGTLDD